ncbi:MAG: GTP-binding protein [Deltaproteobacteria bacterium]|nr:GTP-binding protein [Deltaproteobacteria bacterium]
MNLENFFRGDLEEDPGGALPTLLGAMMIRTQFLPTVRHIVGWRGMRQSSAEPAGWTAKIGGFAGVFGLVFAGTEEIPGRAVGRFGLCYFPDPEEPLVERCSLEAVELTQAGDYRDRIRDFQRHPEMCGLFDIGDFRLAVRKDRRALALALESASSLRTVALDGVRLTREGRESTLIEPGGYDRDFPAFETALAFFDVLAASVSFNLGFPPGCLVERRYPAALQAYDRSGSVSAREAPDLWQGLVALGYGEGGLDALLQAIPEGPGVAIRAVEADGPENAPPEYRDRLWWRAHLLKDSRGVDKKFLGVDERPPLIILTGFLGSGKTSFLQHFIEYQSQRSRFVAVIQNEIGEVGLDGKLLDYTVTEIDEGCVCCSLAGNLKRAVRGILDQFSPDAIILETTGLANPLNMLEEMAELGEIVRFDCTVTLVDALNLNAAFAGGPIASDQIRAADIVVLNKRDLAGDAHMDEACRRVREINPRALVFSTSYGDLNPALVFDADASRPREASSAHATHADAGLWSRTVMLPAPLDRETFLRGVASLPETVFRVKGLVDFTDSGGTMLFQYVCGRFELSVFPKRGVEQRFLTFIGRGNEPDARELLEALSATPGPEV